MKALSIAIALLVSQGAAVISASSLAAVQVSGQDRAQAAGQELLGSLAPRFVLTTIEGQKIDLGDLYGKKAVYLKFWATWCVPCREQMPHFEHAYRTEGADLEVIAINIGFDDSLEEVREYRKKLGITMPIVIDDGRLGSAFNLRVTPQHVVIGRDGRIQYVGHLADERLDAALVAARGSGREGGVQIQKASLRSDQVYHRVGDRLPDLAVSTLDGGTFNLLDSHAGGPTVLVFMSPWCESYLADSRPAIASRCRQVREQIDALAQQEPQVRWLAVASGLWATKDELREYRTRHKTGIPLTLDESGQLFRTFRVMQVPSVLLADAGGRIVRRVEGFDAGVPALVRGLSAR